MRKIVVVTDFSAAWRPAFAAALDLARRDGARLVAAVSQAERSGIIVTGTHGRSGLGRLFMGSVAARVLGTAKCPVLTVRGRRGRTK